MTIGATTVAMSAINTELGRSSTTAISIATAAAGTYGTINTNQSPYPNGSTPHTFSEWRSYNHTAAPTAPSNVNHSVEAETSCGLA